MQSLMLFIYRVIDNLSPELISDSFKEKNAKYYLRSNSTLQLPRICKTTRFGVNTVNSKGRIKMNLHLKKKIKKQNQRHAHVKFINNFNL